MFRLLINYLLFALLIFVQTSCGITEKGVIDSTEVTVPSGMLSFLSTRDGNFEIYTMTSDGENCVNLTNHEALDFWSAWSPDGSAMLFTTNRDGNYEIYSMDADGKNQVNISNHPSNDYLPCWSPDGSQIVFTSDRDSKEREIYTMNVDGSNIVRLTQNELFEEVPTWSPDGSKILFTRQLVETIDSIETTNGELFIMDNNGENVERLTFKKGYDSGGKFSPDGTHIAFYGPTETKNYELFVMNSDGTSITNITNDELEDYSPDWSPDGNWIAYTSGTSSQYDVWMIHLATKTKIRVTTTPKRNESPVWRPYNN